MHVRILVSVILLSAFAAPSRADFYFNGPKNKTWLVVSPQVGGAYGPSAGPVFGAAASYYLMEVGGPGVGVGVYGHGGSFEMDLLAKVSVLGFAGAGVGMALLDGKGGVTGDLWATAAVVGLRYKATRNQEGTSHAWTVFFPLWYLDWE